jgi:hypothetical protein
MEGGFYKITTKEVSMEATQYNGHLLGLRNREQLATTHSAYQARKEEGLIFKP